MKKPFYKFLLLLIGLTLSSTSCGPEEASFKPVIVIDQALVDPRLINEIDFYLYESIKVAGQPLTCSELLETTKLVNPDDASTYDIAYNSKIAFKADDAYKHTFENVPIGKNYVLYVRAWERQTNTKKITRAHGCNYNVTVAANSSNTFYVNLKSTDSN